MTTNEVTSAATEQTKQVAGAAAQATTDVAGTAKEQAGNVAGEAVDQAQQLLQQTAQQLNEQGAEQTRRLAGNIRQISEHLTSMAQAGESGTAQSAVQSAAHRARSVADYLEGKQPGDLLNDVQSFGRRRPGAFLLGAALSGFALGRVAMGAKKAPENQQPSAPEIESVAPASPAAVTPPVGLDPYPTATTATPATPATATGNSW